MTVTSEVKFNLEIEGKSVTETDIGKKVYYKTAHQEGFNEVEIGTIAGLGENYIHVKFGFDFISKACDPKSLRWCDLKRS